ncbi:MAG TPA: peptidoglycan recognition family protein [Actinomycetota bacterium]
MNLRRLAAVVVAAAVVWPAAGAAEAVTPVAAGAPAPSTIKPAIVWKKIPFGAKRKAQTAAYSKRHYGEHTWHLTDPQVVVEHYTDGTSFDSAWNSMAANGVHLGEHPGVCAHFLIDTDGTIYQLVNLGVRCRHAIGMNWTAFGIEHVGTNAKDILHNHAMMSSSLHLTVWLMAKYGIAWGNVIGHAETLESPFHQELYPDWQCSTHADWNRSEMRTYRRRLKKVAHAEGVPIGSPPAWVDSGC